MVTCVCRSPVFAWVTWPGDAPSYCGRPDVLARRLRHVFRSRHIDLPVHVCGFGASHCDVFRVLTYQPLLHLIQSRQSWSTKRTWFPPQLKAAVVEVRTLTHCWSSP